jgi:hypothetical protein
MKQITIKHPKTTKLLLLTLKWAANYQKVFNRKVNLERL